MKLNAVLVLLYHALAAGVVARDVPLLDVAAFEDGGVIDNTIQVSDSTDVDVAGDIDSVEEAADMTMAGDSVPQSSPVDDSMRNRLQEAVADLSGGAQVKIVESLSHGVTIKAPPSASNAASQSAQDVVATPGSFKIASTITPSDAPSMGKLMSDMPPTQLASSLSTTVGHDEPTLNRSEHSILSPVLKPERSARLVPIKSVMGDDIQFMNAYEPTYIPAKHKTQAKLQAAAPLKETDMHDNFQDGLPGAALDDPSKESMDISDVGGVADVEDGAGGAESADADELVEGGTVDRKVSQRTGADEAVGHPQRVIVTTGEDDRDLEVGDDSDQAAGDQVPMARPIASASASVPAIDDDMLEDFHDVVRQAAAEKMRIQAEAAAKVQAASKTDADAMRFDAEVEASTTATTTTREPFQNEADPRKSSFRRSTRSSRGDILKDHLKGLVDSIVSWQPLPVQELPTPVPWLEEVAASVPVTTTTALTTTTSTTTMPPFLVRRGVRRPEPFFEHSAPRPAVYAGAPLQQNEIKNVAEAPCSEPEPTHEGESAHFVFPARSEMYAAVADEPTYIHSQESAETFSGEVPAPVVRRMPIVSPMPMDRVPPQPVAPAWFDSVIPGDGGRSENDEDANDAGPAPTDTPSDPDSYAMTMFLKGRLASMHKENSHLKDMLSQAAAWGKSMKRKVSDLDAERKETDHLKRQLRGLLASQTQAGRELEAEKRREAAAENRVKALQWARQQLADAQHGNRQLRSLLQNVTGVDSALRVQVVAARNGLGAAAASQLAVVERVQRQRAALGEEERSLQALEQGRGRLDAELAQVRRIGSDERRLRQVVTRRDQLLRRGLQQLLAERAGEQQLRGELAEQGHRLAGQLQHERSNATAFQLELAASRVKELERSGATAWREAVAGDEAGRDSARSVQVFRKELRRLRANDGQLQAGAALAQQRVEAEKRLLQNSTQWAQLASEGRDAAQAEAAEKETAIGRINQQHAALLRENRELRTFMAKAKREESQLLHEAMGSLDNTAGLDFHSLTAEQRNATDTPPGAALAALAHDADMPTLDVMSP